MITSLQNEQVKHVVSLHEKKGRNEFGEFLVEGKRFVQEALLRKAIIRKIYYCADSDATNNELMITIPQLIQEAEKQHTHYEEVSETVMRKMSATEEPQGIVAIVRKPIFDWQDIRIEENTILLVIDGIQDPGNLGTILRTALAADVTQIILTKKTVDVYNPKVLRSSMGSIFSQTIILNKTPQEVGNICRSNQCTMVVSAMDGSSIYRSDIRKDYPLALIIGNEAIGPDAFFTEKADKKYAIPMFNHVESLNASMAAGIFLYEMRRQGQFL
ncbi:RNA methyltransferase [Dehalobacter sp. DCM]|uniref:TrmH family RNA methyltransferase n=1 Tax=Dehalobacter sp. DCM TaxID=2907827 RepID=UPI0030821016|nr:RNA methyltransferase [Dehalobacter sp. DCM]